MIFWVVHEILSTLSFENSNSSCEISSSTKIYDLIWFGCSTMVIKLYGDMGVPNCSSHKKNALNLRHRDLN